jgi:hypothetical protein
VDAVDRTASFAEQLGKKGSDAAEVAAPYVDRASKAFAPIGETTSKLFERNVAPLASDVASSASKAASSALTGLGSSLKEQGLPLDVVEGAYKTVSTEAPKAYTAAKPVLEGVAEVRNTFCRRWLRALCPSGAHGDRGRGRWTHHPAGQFTPPGEHILMAHQGTYILSPCCVTLGVEPSALKTPCNGCTLSNGCSNKTFTEKSNSSLDYLYQRSS